MKVVLLAVLVVLTQTGCRRSDAAERRDDPPEPRLVRLVKRDARVVVPNREPGLELSVDSVGFERRQPEPPGKTTWERDKRTYLKLTYAWTRPSLERSWSCLGRASRA